MPGFPPVYTERLGIANARLLEQAVGNPLVQAHLLSIMRGLTLRRRPLKVALLGGGPCLETRVIMCLRDRWFPALEVQFKNIDKVPLWQAGHSALNVQLET